MRTVVHLYCTKEDPELLILRGLLAKFGYDELQGVDPFVRQVQILDQNPVASRLCLLDSILNRLIQALSHLEVLQFCRCMLSNLLLEEELKLVEDVDGVGDEEEYRRRGR